MGQSQKDADEGNRNVKKFQSGHATVAAVGSLEHEPAFFPQWNNYCHLGNTNSSGAGQAHA